MAENILLTFGLLFGATIALICAIYVALIARKNRKQLIKEQTQLQN